MPLLSTDLLMIERSGTLHKATVADLPTAGGGGGDISALEAAVAALQAEIAEARGDRSSLGLRIGNVSNFASPNAGGVIVGQYYDNAFHGITSTVLAGQANRVDMAPFFTSQRMRIDEIGVVVSTAVASSLVNVFIYESSPEGWPDQLIYEGPSGISAATVGLKTHTLDFTFDAGRQYWLGMRHSSTATIRSINTSSAVNLGVQAGNGTAYFTMVRRLIPFANPLPINWGFQASERIINTSPPSIRMRAAALV